MAYEPTNWKSGDVVTSAKLNKLEQGVVDANAVLVVRESWNESSYVWDCTYEEIYQHMSNGGAVVLIPAMSNVPEPVMSVIFDDDYEVFVAESANANTSFSSPRLQITRHTLSGKDAVEITHTYYSLTAVN